MKYYYVLLCTLIFMSGGCLRKTESVVDGQHWIDFVQNLTNFNAIAVLDDYRDGFSSTSDPEGGNNDFNNFEGPSRRNPGWVVVLDREGPGVVDRFWMTGMDYGHPIRIYFDGETTPRIDGAVEELFGKNQQPFVFPLAAHINQCWWSYVPLTFNRRITIETLAPNVHPHWGQRRLYFQVNYRLFDEAVETFPQAAGRGEIGLPDVINEVWRHALDIHRSAELADDPVLVPSGERILLYEHSGPGILSEWALDVRPLDSDAEVLRRNALLQSTIIEIRYNGLSEPSFSAPLADLFNSGWRRRTWSTFAASSFKDGFVLRLPMPFSQSIAISLVNTSEEEIEALFRAGDVTDWSEQHGYLHAVWNRSGPEWRGHPHHVARWKGRGKYVGCYVGVTAQDKSWWILEGDEQLRVDGLSFSGTGFEDYFNGGWYYRGASFAPMSGILDRYPFRVGQYRYRIHDAVRFNQEFVLDWERGDQNVSAGWIRSVAFAYLEKPQVVPDSAARTDREAERNPFEDQSLMLQLFELERSQDFNGAIDLIDEWLALNPADRHAGVLALRRVEYRRFLGERITDKEWNYFLTGEHGERAQHEAELLSWFYESPDRYIVGVCNNASGVVTVNDNTLIRSMHPLQLQVAGIELGNGRHRLVSDVRPVRAWPWVQMGIRGHSGVAGTGPDKTIVERGDPVRTQSVNRNDTMRGPPHDEMYVNAVPNAFILLQSSVHGIRAADWDWHQDRVRVIVDFDTEAMSFTPYSEIVQGLPPWPQ